MPYIPAWCRDARCRIIHASLDQKQSKITVYRGLLQAARLFGKAPAKFHTLEYGAQGLGEPQVEVPKELQEGPTPLHESHMEGVTALDEAEQDQSRLRELEGQARQSEIEEGQEVGLVTPVMCPAALRCAAACTSGFVAPVSVPVSLTQNEQPKPISSHNTITGAISWLCSTDGVHGRQHTWSCAAINTSTDHLQRLQHPAWVMPCSQVPEGSGRRQEAGREHTATAAALQSHQDAAEDAIGRQQTAQPAGPQGRGEWGYSLEEDDGPVSPASSSGSALDPQLFRFALS